MNKNFDIEKFTDSITQMMSCKASIRANTPLSICLETTSSLRSRISARIPPPMKTKNMAITP